MELRSIFCRRVTDKLGGLLFVLLGSCEIVLFFALTEIAVVDRSTLVGVYVPNIVSRTM